MLAPYSLLDAIQDSFLLRHLLFAVLDALPIELLRQLLLVSEGSSMCHNSLIYFTELFVQIDILVTDPPFVCSDDLGVRL